MTVTDNKTPRRSSRYVYAERSAQDVKRHTQRALFPEAVRQAYGGNLEPLHEYLRAFLPEYHADAIIEWARRRLRRGLIKRAPSPEREAEDLIIAYVRGRLRYRRQRPLPGGEYQRLIEQVSSELAEEGDLDRADPERINYKRILKSIRRGKKRKHPKA